MTPNPDIGIDLSIHRIDRDGDGYSDQGSVFDVQLKSTTVAVHDPDDDVFRYDLNVKAYEFLRGEPLNAARILVLFVMPEDEALWLAQDQDGLLLRKCAYYLSLQGMPATENVRDVRVSVPCRQVFSADFLQQKFQER